MTNALKIFPFKAYDSYEEIKKLQEQELTPQEIEIRKKWDTEDVVDFTGRNIGKFLDLRYANLYTAKLYGANLEYPDLRYADLRYADLKWATLRSADLRGANLSSANLQDANLQRANLKGADLSGAEYLEFVNLWDAKYNKYTKFPPSFNPADYKMIYED